MPEPQYDALPGQPVIVAKDLGVQFNRGRRSQGLREILFRRGFKMDEKSFWPLRNVSFSVQPGEAIGVIGRNGSGKSTLLKLVAGVMLPDEGSVNVHGEVSPLIEITGGFVPHLTGRENVYLAAGLHGMSREEVDERFDDIIDFAEDQVRNALDTPFRHYSSGMKVRLAFAVVSSLNGPILLVDEVLAVGDAAFRRKCYERIDSMLSEGRTLFLVSHNGPDLTRFCQRGLYLRGGGLEMDGPVGDVLKHYEKLEG